MDAEAPNAVLAERRDVADGLAFFLVEPDAKPYPSFEPGQFTNLGLEAYDAAAGEVRFQKRAYSMGSSPLARERVEFYLRRVPGGRFSEALFALRAGARVWLDRAVYGRFTLEPLPPERDAILIASGTGVAPYLSMLRTYAGRRRWRRAVLVESVRDSRELGYRAELEALQRRDPSFVWLPTATREPATSGWSGARGRIQTLLDPAGFERRTGVPLSRATAHAFLCGNPEMIGDVGAALATLGFRPHSRRSPGEMHAERYW